MVSRLGRGWKPTTEFQRLLFNTYTTKANISKVLGLSQPTLMLGLSQPTLILVLKDQQRLNLKQLSRISKDSGKSLMELIKMI